tara:strand:- start:153 stop:290 length:138 start_codon:yes stop_codon:yes gene_type:complete
MTIPWKGSEEQLTVLLSMGIVVAYSLYIVIANKDSSERPRKSLWR